MASSWRPSGLMISVQDLGTNLPDSSSGWGRYVAFLDRNLYSHSTSIRCIKKYQQSQQPDKSLILREACDTTSLIYLRYGFALSAAETYHLLTD